MWSKICHTVILVAWLSAAVVMGTRLVLLGNEESALKRRAAADLQERNRLVDQLAQVRNEIDYASSEVVLATQIRRLDLPLQRPLTVARVTTRSRDVER